MAEYAGIPHARDVRGDLWPREAIDRTHPPFSEPLACGRCGVPVRARRSHTRQGKRGRVIDVAACYYLHSGGEHEPDCPYDFERRARGIRQESRGTIEHRDGHWRLLLPNPTETTGESRASALARAAAPRRRLQITPSRSRLAPAINSAGKIARLLAEFDDHPDAAEQFRAHLGNIVLTWREFCYGPRDYQRLAETLTTGQPSHPIAVHGRTFALADRGGSHALRAHGRARLDDTWIPVVLRSRRADLLAPAVDRCWLAYGSWQHWTGQRGYRELQLWITRPWQITTWNS